jgi:hypothetical protein
MRQIPFSFQTRDQILLNKVAQVGYVTPLQASSKIMYTNPDYTKRRLRKLAMMDLLCPHFRRDGGKTKVYAVNYRAAQGLIPDDSIAKARRALELKTPPWDRLTTTHEDLVRDWALLFLELPSTNVSLDYMINDPHWGFYSDGRDCQKKIPDFLVHIGQLEFGVEIELHAKDSKTYFRILKELLRRENRNILYLAQESSIQRKIIKIYDEVGFELQRFGQKQLSKVVVKRFEEVPNVQALTSILTSNFIPKEVFPDDGMKVIGRN